MFTDSHCHLHDRQFFTEEQAEQMLKNAHENGVTKIICIGTDPQDSLAAKEFAERHEGVFWTYGIHPSEANKTFSAHSGGCCRSPLGTRERSDGSAAEPREDGREERGDEKALFASTRLVAIGEVGLDYHYEPYDRAAQIHLFEEMLQLAMDNNLPVSFHIREAFDDFFAVAKNFPKVRGVVHSFSDSKKNLKKILETTDFYIGVNGLATYSTLPTPPLDRILLETDAPFLTPFKKRDTINEPAYIKDIAYWLSTKLGVSPEQISEQTEQNVQRLFSLSNSILR